MLNQLFSPITKVFNKLPTSGQILILIIIFLSVVVFFNSLPPCGSGARRSASIEGYEQRDNFLFMSGPTEIYDDFYANIYDHLVYNSLKDDYEVGIILNRTSPTTKSVILDVGCGTGHHVAKLAEQGLNVLGIDISPSMVAKAKQNYPEYHFEVGNALNPSQFMFASFTHILCLYFTIYYFPDKTIFFQNCMQWLMPGGYLVVHLVDRDNFDPILPAGNPLYIVSPQRYAKKRITNTKVKFEDFTYEADFQPNDGSDTYDGTSAPGNGGHANRGQNQVALFNEKVTLNNGKTRKNQHTFYMEPEEDILVMAQQVGFIYQAKVDLIKCAYENQYLYILTKPE